MNRVSKLVVYGLVTAAIALAVIFSNIIEAMEITSIHCVASN